MRFTPSTYSQFMRMTLQPLALCHGFSVVGADGAIGTVETPLFPPDAHEPDYLVVRAGGDARQLVPCGLVAAVDGDRRIVSLAVPRAVIDSLPRDLPVVPRLRQRRPV